MFTLLDFALLASVGTSTLIGVVVAKRFNKESSFSESSADEVPTPRTLHIEPPRLVSPVLTPFEEYDETGISLTLDNMGGDLIFQGISIQEHNELKVAYFPDFESPNMHFVPSGKPIRFLLKGPYENATFHFSVIYCDHKGNTYSQKVAGWGLERPLLESPLELCA